jgi:hypothetical protein
MKLTINRKILFIIVFLLFGCEYPQKNISEIKNITALSQADFHSLDKQTLVVFDVDEVLTAPNASSGMFTTHRNEYGNLIKEFKKKYPKYASDYEMYSSIIFKSQQEVIIDKDTLSLLKNLKSKNIKTIACSTWPSGPQGVIPNMASHRYDVLRALKITFDWSFSNDVFYLNQKLYPKTNNEKVKKPLYYKGVICTDGEDKGMSLLRFFRHKKYYPKTIIFFDDSLNKIKDVQQMCKENNINFYGYHYTNRLDTHWNETLVRFKIKKLIEDKTWFKNDEQALKAFKDSSQNKNNT